MSTLFDSLRHRNIPITLSTFRIDSIRRLFPTTNRPSELLIAAFPHLNIHRRFFSTSPMTLARDECRIKRKKLEALRDDRALRIGLLASASHDLEHTLSTHSTSQLTQHVILLSLALSPLPQLQSSLQPRLDQEFLFQLDESNRNHVQEIGTLRRPSKLVRMWPKLVIIPPTIYFVSRTLYTSRESIAEHFKEAAVTVRVFWESWVLQPIRNILDTIKTGGDEGMRVISKDALRADMEVSLWVDYMDLYSS
jgi:nuclear-control-of-ATPase protein 2